MKNKMLAVHAAAAGVSVVLGTVSTYPLDTLKTLIQVGSSTTKPLMVNDVFHMIQVLSGHSGWYHGCEWLTVGRSLGLGVRFGVYEILTAFYKDGREDDYVSVAEAMMAGIAAGMMESLVTSPFELLKIRAQVASASRTVRSPKNAKKSVTRPLVSRLLPRCSLDMTAMNNSLGILSTLPTKHVNMLDSLKEYPWMMTGSGRPPTVTNVRMPSEIISLEGWTALWRGLRAGIVRDSIFGAVFFSSWQFLYESMRDWKALGMNPIPRYNKEVGPLSPIAVSLAAGVSGSLAAAVSHRFDTARTRSQCVIFPKYILMERKFLKRKTPGSTFERLTGIHPADRNLLSRGIWLRMARSGVASSILVGSYFFAVNHLVPN